MDSEHDTDSLFGSDAEPSSEPELAVHDGGPVASRLAPDIPGLFFFPDLLSRDVHDQVLQQVAACGYFDLPDEPQRMCSEAGQRDTLPHGAYTRSPRNQAMLFARSLHPAASNQQGGRTQQTGGWESDNKAPGCSGLPDWAINFIHHLQQLLTSVPDHQLPAVFKGILFPTERPLSRQLILNLYRGAEGLASHVDLLDRFADGILLCSFGPQGTGTVMDFTHKTCADQHLFLPSGSILLLCGEARFDWKHGINARHIDLVQSATCPHHIDALKRSIRLSITIRSMLPGADVVGQ